ncbi:MAG: aldo/keto reductase, partial [Chthoniobacterales bacterium]
IQRLDAEIEKVIGPLWPLEWVTGIPDSTKMPGNINVREIVRLWVMFKAFDLTEFARERYNLFGEGGHWFPGLQAVDIDAAKLQPLIHSNPLRERIPQILQEAHELFAAEQKKRLSQG